MKYRKLMTCICIASMGFTACGKGELSSFQQAEVPTASITKALEETIPDAPMQEWMEGRCEEIAAVYRPLYEALDGMTPSQSDIDAMEEALIREGLDVIDTNEIYPSYLVTPDHVHSFWDAVQNQQQAQQEVILITASGALAYRLFTYDGIGGFLYSMTYPLDGDRERSYEVNSIKDWELTEKDNFFYRILPANDKHYPDFSLIHLNPADHELYNMTLHYIFPVSYVAANVFLVDWSEEDRKSLSFNDQFEYLYLSRFGKQFNADEYPMLKDQYGYAIPAEEFEAVVLPYYNIDLNTFRELSQYNSDGNYYPWRPLETNDFAFIWYYNIEPQVTAYRKNADGTLTLTVEALSSDLKTDCLFAHEVTVRPLENGAFQYVGNRVTYQTKYGLPCTIPRRMWNF